MKLAKPFFRLPVRFDVERLRVELDALPESAWANHPNEIRGNTSVRLVSVGGEENDAVDGVMLPTDHLARAPYMRQVLASFGVVWSRSRLLKLAPLAGVPQHADINYHWFNRVRLHIPIITHPDVRFHCGDEQVHMAEGEAWIFDNWRLHRVENPVDASRIHLVADTSGSASFWHLVGSAGASVVPRQHRFDPALDAWPLTERTALRPVMPPAEVDLLLTDLQSELTVPPSEAEGLVLTARYRGLLDAFRRDWRQAYQLFGETPTGRTEYTRLRDGLRAASQAFAGRLIMRTNRISAHVVLEGRVLLPALPMPPSPSVSSTAARNEPAPGIPLRRPVFIVAAPRSGSTLLFETLASGTGVCTLGGEAHWLVESIPELRTGAPGVESNRLDASHANPIIANRIAGQITAHLKDYQGQSVPAQTTRRFLEKTPKNALRVPFFDALFPDALFIFLWRDPRENMSSIMEAWRSGLWKTYNGLDGFEGPWSLLLPPDWRNLYGKELEEIAAFQWESTNRILLDDLAALAHDRWTSVSYAELRANPADTVRRLCSFADIPFDETLAARVAVPLPLSRFTQTPPEPDKWRRNETAITRVLPQVSDTWRRLETLS